MSDQQLGLLLAEVVLLVLAARVGGELALRVGIPEVVGELAMGLCLGPSLFGQLFPGAFEAIFPPDPEQRALLDLVGWIAVLLLVQMAGSEVQLGLLRQAGRSLAATGLCAFLLPFASGYAFALLVPQSLIAEGTDRTVFALFLATAMSISAIPVIARILLDMDLMHTQVGTLIVASAVAGDTAGWMLLAVVVALVNSNGVDTWQVAGVLFGTAFFLLVALTVGQGLVRLAMKASRRLRAAHAQTALMLLIVFAGGAITEAIGVHLALGAFVAGILIARSPDKDSRSLDAIREVGIGFFAPFFFVYTGIKADLTTLGGSTLAVATAAVVVATLSKLAGGGLGARLGGMSAWESAAVGAGLNARGAMELVIAAIGLSLGILTPAAYSMLVLVAMVTSLMAAPMIRACLIRARVEGSRVVLEE